jgi:hypothetical protein
MTSVILKLSVSLDGYIAPADGSSDWEAAGCSPDGAEWVLDRFTAPLAIEPVRTTAFSRGAVAHVFTTQS